MPKIKKIISRVKGINYRGRIRNEIVIFQNALRNHPFQEGPPVWIKANERFSIRIKNTTGVNNLCEYIVRHLQGKYSAKILSLGAGICKAEFEWIVPPLKEQNCQIDLTCIDINADFMKQASIEAKERRIFFNGIVQDANEITLKSNTYDVVLAHAALHHFLKLDHIAKQINLSLRPDGIFVTVDIPTRNGYKMWDETLEVVNSIWKVIPDKFRIDHTKYLVPTYSPIYGNIDSSKYSFECINSEAILPALRKHMEEVYFIPAFSIARRFFDAKFGPNYDITQSLDNTIFEFIMNLDEHYIENKILKPETFFGVYRKK